MSTGAGPRFEVRVVDEVLAEDLARCTRAARAAIESVVVEVRRDGVPFEWLRRCEEEGHDGTRLGGCVKFYIPARPGSGEPSWLATRKLQSRRSSLSPSASVILRSSGSRASTRSPTVVSIGVRDMRVIWTVGKIAQQAILFLPPQHPKTAPHRPARRRNLRANLIPST